MICSIMTLQPGSPPHTLRKCYRIDRRSICLTRFIFEAYDGIAVVETIDPEIAVIALHIAPGCEAIVEGVIKDLQRQHFIEPVAETKPPEASVQEAGIQNR